LGTVFTGQMTQPTIHVMELTEIRWKKVETITSKLKLFVIFDNTVDDIHEGAELAWFQFDF